MKNLGLLVRVYFQDYVKIKHILNAPGAVGHLISRTLLFLIIGGSIVFSLGYYNWIFASALHTFGRADLAVVAMMAIASILVLVFTIFRANTTVFSFTDYPLQAAMPIRRETLILSRVVIFYIEILAVVLAIMLPAIAVYGYLVRPGAGFYVLVLISSLMIPAVPVIFGTALGLVVSLVASKFRWRNFIQIFMLFGFFGITMWFSIQSGTLTDQAMLDFGLMMEESVLAMYPLATMFSRAVFDGNIGAFALFLGVGVAVMLLFSLIVGRCFTWIHTRLNTQRVKGRYKIASVSTNSPFMALYKREVKRYTSSPTYVVNTSIGPLLLIATAGYLLFQSDFVLEIVRDVFPDYDVWLPGLIGMFAAGVLTMGGTTPCAISIDGPYINLFKSMPVLAKSVFLAKMMLNLTIALPLLLVFLVIAGVSLGVSPLGWLGMALLPTTFVIMMSALGLVINLRFPKLSWKSEAAVVKQSASVLVSLVVGMVLVAASVFLGYQVLPPGIGVYALSALYAVIAGVALWYLFGPARVRFQNLTASLTIPRELFFRR